MRGDNGRIFINEYFGGGRVERWLRVEEGWKKEEGQYKKKETGRKDRSQKIEVRISINNIL